MSFEGAVARTRGLDYRSGMPFDGVSTPDSTRDDAVAVVRRLRECGHMAYFAGGCVRDMLMGLEPKDFDVATDAPPERVRELFRNTQSVGAAFGVVLVRIGASVVEVATFRADAGYSDGRRPDSVRFTTAEEDAKRRDFTINGLFLDPMQGDALLDFVGGRADVAAKVLRAIGNPAERFEEDHLRVLRGVRFAARFGLTIEPTTAAAMRAAAVKLPRISPERIADELRRMLTAPTRGAAGRLLHQLDMLPVLWRLFDRRTAARKSPLDHLGGGPVSFGVALAAAYLSLEHPSPIAEGPKEVAAATKAARTSWKLSNEVSSEFAGVLEGVRVMNAGPEPTLARRKRFAAGAYARPSRDLAAAVLAAEVGNVARLRAAEESLAALDGTDAAPPPLLTGDDLTAAGLMPGKSFKVILDHVYDEQLEGRLTDSRAALELALSMAR